jgi:hypothetical protein
MFYNILDASRKELLPLLAPFKLNYYLAGGTGLALQIGHRKSEDFDFFTPQPFSTDEVFKEIEKYLAKYTLVKIQDEENTLTLVVNNNVKISFFCYPYPLLKPLLEDENLKIASIVDIGCMKLSTITHRATFKDYVDLYFILKNISLNKLLEQNKKKHPQLDANFVLKSLIYLDDISKDPIEFIPGFAVSFDQVKTFLTSEVKKYFET